MGAHGVTLPAVGARCCVTCGYSAGGYAGDIAPCRRFSALRRLRHHDLPPPPRRHPSSPTTPCDQAARPQIDQRPFLSQNTLIELAVVWIPLSAVAETMHRRVCPLYTIDDASRVRVVGSAVPFDAAGFRFLITATHVHVAPSSSLSRSIFTMGPSVPCLLSGRRIIWEYARGLKPDIDLSLIELKDEEAMQLEQQYQFTTPTQTGIVERPKTDVYYIMAGYPAARNRVKSHRFYPSAKATHLITGDVRGVQQLGLVGKTDACHFALSIPFETVPSLTGGDFRVPKAAGMSGGGVWRISMDRHNKMVTAPVLVGIAIEHHRSRRLFVATRVQQAIPLLHDLIGFVKAGRWPEPSGA